mmetsp:Transcript_56044/g.120664  ORF Transcript_56044/g.120664 Transcript_56044/m.120664 type:complete len:335 (+) Transcript_56044:2711-3715(+)
MGKRPYSRDPSALFLAIQVFLFCRQFVHALMAYVFNFDVWSHDPGHEHQVIGVLCRVGVAHEVMAEDDEAVFFAGERHLLHAHVPSGEQLELGTCAPDYVHGAEPAPLHEIEKALDDTITHLPFRQRARVKLLLLCGGLQRCAEHCADALWRQLHTKEVLRRLHKKPMQVLHVAVVVLQARVARVQFLEQVDLGVVLFAQVSLPELTLGAFVARRAQAVLEHDVTRLCICSGLHDAVALALQAFGDETRKESHEEPIFLPGAQRRPWQVEAALLAALALELLHLVRGHLRYGAGESFDEVAALRTHPAGGPAHPAAGKAVFLAIVAKDLHEPAF